MRPSPTHVDPEPHRSGQTTPHEQGEAVPRLPHERDESSDSQSATPDPMIQQAHTDLVNGQQDTDRGPVTDQVYESQVRPGATPHRGAPSAPASTATPSKQGIRRDRKA